MTKLERQIASIFLIVIGIVSIFVDRDATGFVFLVMIGALLLVSK